MKQPNNAIFSDKWAGDFHYSVSVIEEGTEFADIGVGETKLSALRAARKRLDVLGRKVDRLIDKETK